MADFIPIKEQKVLRTTDPKFFIRKHSLFYHVNGAPFVGKHQSTEKYKDRKNYWTLAEPEKKKWLT